MGARKFNAKTDCWRCGKTPTHKKDLCENCYDIVFVKKIDIHQIMQKSNHETQ